eukprot:scaffold154156_cov22-Tisochrysis_lutea.AAC.1
MEDCKPPSSLEWSSREPCAAWTFSLVFCASLITFLTRCRIAPTRCGCNLRDGLLRWVRINDRLYLGGLLAQNVDNILPKVNTAAADPGHLPVTHQATRIHIQTRIPMLCVQLCCRCAAFYSPGFVSKTSQYFISHINKSLIMVSI